MPHYCYGSGLQHSETDEYPNSYPGALHWPPYSPDLNTCDFFLWGHVKDLVYKKKSADLISLKRTITDSFASIRRKTLELVTDNFATGLRYCITSDGSHFENIKILFNVLFNKKKYSAICNDSRVISVKSCRIIKSHPVLNSQTKHGKRKYSNHQ
ncbi:hypothetical protein AVEN_92931-1 [Araneus ventricosus]|uniref:Tc1-like transposase DDE domain-containing protein n=1 Tax=Araneus ventricosus TaxID=182803 RepID=A0A4Y2D2B0_ARAVE|nr:hypothetical protein AVEN_92931-1 [Araneus ventricosus]